jgi:HrpA-like RNA helicase
MRKRPDLKMVVASATSLDVQGVCDFFERDAHVVNVLAVQNRSHPVDILYLNTPCPNYVQAAVETAVMIHTQVHSLGLVVDVCRDRFREMYCVSCPEKKISI